MGCKQYFAVDLDEDFVDEGDSRSFFTNSRTREFSACFTTARGNPSSLKSMSTSFVIERSVCVPYYRDLSQHLNWYSCSQRNVHRFPENGSVFWANNGSSRFIYMLRVFVGRYDFQSPSEQLSGYNRLRVFREEWWRSIVSDRTSILSSEQDWCRPQYTVLWCFFHTLCMYLQDVVLPSWPSQDLCVLCP